MVVYSKNSVFDVFFLFDLQQPANSRQSLDCQLYILYQYWDTIVRSSKFYTSRSKETFMRFIEVLGMKTERSIQSAF